MVQFKLIFVRKFQNYYALGTR